MSFRKILVAIDKTPLGAVVFEQALEEVMSKQMPTISSNMKVKELADRIAEGDPLLARYQAVLIVDQTGQLAGIISRGDVLRALEQNFETDRTVLEAGSQDLVVTFPDELVISRGC